MGIFNINGMTIKGNNIVINDGKIIVDGVTLKKEFQGIVELIVTGDVQKIISDSAVTIKGDVLGSIDAGNSVEVEGDVHGNVKAGNSVYCKNIGGDAKAGNSIHRS